MMTLILVMCIATNIECSLISFDSFRWAYKLVINC